MGVWGRFQEEILEEGRRRKEAEARADEEAIMEIHQRALDDIVNVNSLFTMAVFVGLAFASPGQKSLESPECDAGLGVAKRLIVYEVVSFAFFLLSSLTAKTLKVQLHIHRFNNKASLIRYKVFRGGMLSVSFMGSFAGIMFLTLSMVNVIQIRLGKLGCRSVGALLAVAWLCGIVALALAIYLPSTINVIWVLTTKFQCKQQTEYQTKTQTGY